MKQIFYEWRIILYVLDTFMSQTKEKNRTERHVALGTQQHVSKSNYLYCLNYVVLEDDDETTDRKYFLR